MAITLVAHAVAASSDGGTSATTPAIDTTGANLLIVVATFLSTSGPVIADSKSQPMWAPVIGNSAVGVSNQMYYTSAAAIVGAGHTFTITTTAGFPSIEVLAFSGALATNAVQPGASSTPQSTPATTIQPGSVSPDANGYVLVTGLFNNEGSGSPSIDQGFTISDYADQGASQNYGSAAAYLIQGVAGAVNPTWTKNNNVAVATMAAFKVASVARVAQNYSLNQAVKRAAFR